MTFRLPAVGLDCADWQMNDAHVCKPGGCGSQFIMKWRPECAEVYAEVLAENREPQDQFNQAIDRGDHEGACFLFALNDYASRWRLLSGHGWPGQCVWAIAC